MNVPVTTPAQEILADVLPRSEPVEQSTLLAIGTYDVNIERGRAIWRLTELYAAARFSSKHKIALEALRELHKIQGLYSGGEIRGETLSKEEVRRGWEIFVGIITSALNDVSEPLAKKLFNMRKPSKERFVKETRKAIRAALGAALSTNKPPPTTDKEN